MRRLAVTLCLLALASTNAFGAPFPTIIDDAIAATESAHAGFPFEYHLTTAHRDWRLFVDPWRSPRVRLLTPDHAALTERQQQSFSELSAELLEVAWCANARLRAANDMRLIHEDAETANYAFQPTADSLRGEWALRSDTSRRFAQYLRGEVVFSKRDHDVISVRFYTPGVIRPIPFVRIDAFNVTMQCALAPNRRRYASRIDTHLRGVSFGSALEQRTTEHFMIPAEAVAAVESDRQ